MREGSKILFVDDGSEDKTWDIIQHMHNTDPIFSGVKLSCNRGQQKCTFGWTHDSYAHG